MTWLHPQAAWWFLLAIPVVLLYILRRRRRRLVVATTLFWQEVWQESAPRAWWQKLRHGVSLLLQLLFLALLVTALMEPVRAGSQRDRMLVVLVLDHSASMNAWLDPGQTERGTRLDRATQIAREYIHALGSDDEALILTTADRAQVLCGRTQHRGTLLDALEEVRPTDLPGHPEAALKLAAGLPGHEGHRRVVWISDQAPAGDTAALAGANPEWVPVGNRHPNAGVTALAGRIDPSDPTMAVVDLEVGWFSSEPGSFSVAMNRDGRPYDSFFFELGPNQRANRRIRLPLQGGRLLEWGLDMDDALITDNHAALMLPEPTPIVVQLLGTPNLFLEEVLRAQARLVLAGPDLPAEQVDFCVVHGEIPETLPDCPIWILAPRTDGPDWSAGPVHQSPVLQAGAVDHPLMRHVDVASIHAAWCRTLVPPAGAEVLIDAFGSPVYAAWVQTGKKRLVLSLDLARTDLALRTAFPILVANAMQWLVPSAIDRPWAFQPGEPIQVDPREGMSTERWVHPQGLSISAREAMTVGVPRAGVYRLDPVPAGDPSGRCAVNLSHAGESNVYAESGSDDYTPAPLQTGLRPGRRPLWIYLVVAAGLCTVFEWVAHHRRWVD